MFDARSGSLAAVPDRHVTSRSAAQDVGDFVGLLDRYLSNFTPIGSTTREGSSHMKVKVRNVLMGRYTVVLPHGNAGTAEVEVDCSGGGDNAIHQRLGLFTGHVQDCWAMTLSHDQEVR